MKLKSFGQPMAKIW